MQAAPEVRLILMVSELSDSAAERAHRKALGRQGGTVGVQRVADRLMAIGNTNLTAGDAAAAAQADAGPQGAHRTSAGPPEPEPPTTPAPEGACERTAELPGDICAELGDAASKAFKIAAQAEPAK